MQARVQQKKGRSQRGVRDVWRRKQYDTATPPWSSQLAAHAPGPEGTHLKQGREHVKGVHRTGAVRVAHELVDVAPPGLLCIVAGRRLERSQDGGEEGRGGRGHAPGTFSEAGRDADGSVEQHPPPHSPPAVSLQGGPVLPTPHSEGCFGNSARVHIFFQVPEKGTVTSRMSVRFPIPISFLGIGYLF